MKYMYTPESKRDHSQHIAKGKTASKKKFHCIWDKINALDQETNMGNVLDQKQRWVMCLTKKHRWTDDIKQRMLNDRQKKE